MGQRSNVEKKRAIVDILTGNTSRCVAHLSVFAGLLTFLGGTAVQAQYGHYVQAAGSNLFVIGIYNYPGGVNHADETHFAEINNYANTVDFFCHHCDWIGGSPGENLTTSILDSAATNGLYITAEMWQYYNWDDGHNYCADSSQLAVGSAFYNDLQNFGNHPALLMFANVDEPDVSKWVISAGTTTVPLSQIVAASQFMGNYGRGKSVWLNEGGSYGQVSAQQPYAQYVSVFSNDAYPDEGWGLDGPKECVDADHKVAPSATIMSVLPAYPSANGNILNSNSMSYVAYTCIIHGAAGIWWWGGEQLASNSDPIWQDIELLGAQLKHMQRALIDPSAYRFYNNYSNQWVGTGINESGGSGEFEMLMVSDSNVDYLITANTSTSAQTYTISSVAGWRGGTNLWYFCGTDGTNNQVLGRSITYGPKQAVVYASQSIKVPPIIIIPTAPTQVCLSGATVNGYVDVLSWWPMTYQWYLNGNPINGQTSATLTLNNTQTSTTTGNYTEIISNGRGSVTNVINITVLPKGIFCPAATIAGDGDALTEGSFVYAYDLSGTNATVNSVPFTGSTSTTALGANITLSGFTYNFTGYGANITNLSASYTTVLTGGDYVDATNTATITLKNLTVGRSYAVQLWVNDSRTFGAGRNLTVATGDGKSFMFLDYNNTDVTSGLGQYTIGTFTASATTQTFTLNGNQSTQLNAIQLRDVTGNSPIIFGAANAISGDTDVTTAGALVYAYDLSGTTATVNGTTFTGASSTTALGANITLSGFYANYIGYGTDITNLSANYTNVLTGGDYANGATAVKVTLKNLMVGHSYAVQLWVDDSRSFGFGIGRTITVTTIATNANSVTLGYDLNGLGQYTIGTFTASAATQTFTIFGNSSTQLNAIQLRDITGVAPITFGAANTISGDTDVSTNGVLVYAYDLSGTSAAANGVTFAGASSTTTLSTNITLSGFYANYNGYGFNITNLSSGYTTVLTGGDYAGGANVVTITLNNLTVGHSYAVQLWVDDSRSFGIGRYLTVTSVAVGGNSVILNYNNTGTIGGLGQYTIGTFTASATTQMFALVGNASSQLNAIQLLDTSTGGSISITGTVRNANGSVTLSATGSSGNSYVAQFTTNLAPPVVWQNISTNVADSNGLWQFTDTNAPNHPAGFYRTLYQP